MRRQWMPVSLLAVLALAAALGAGSAAGPAGTADKGDGAAAEGPWAALDISAAMNADVVQTPNEWLRTWQLWRDDVLRGDEDHDLDGDVLDARHTVALVFGQHSMVSWASTSYHVAGRYPHFDGYSLDAPSYGDAVPGLPPDGRVGRYRLYVDELESRQWHLSQPDDPRPGRNAVCIYRGGRDDAVTVTLPERQQRRYRALNLLYAAAVNYTTNCVRIAAVYGDGSRATLYQGPLADFHGQETFAEDRRGVVPQLPGQREVLACSPLATGYREPHFRDLRYGRAVLHEFVKPLPLEASKPLRAIVFETVYDDPAGGKPLSGPYWAVHVLAASALPTE